MLERKIVVLSTGRVAKLSSTFVAKPKVFLPRKKVASSWDEEKKRESVHLTRIFDVCMCAKMRLFFLPFFPFSSFFSRSRRNQKTFPTKRKNSSGASFPPLFFVVFSLSLHLTRAHPADLDPYRSLLGFSDRQWPSRPRTSVQEREREFHRSLHPRIVWIKERNHKSRTIRRRFTALISLTILFLQCIPRDRNVV